MIRRIKRMILGGSNEKIKYNSSQEKPDAIILAAGMMGRNKLFPKALYEHGGRSAIEHQINWLKPHVRKIIIACHKKEHEAIASAIGDVENVEFVLETQLLGTAGAVKNAMDKTKTSAILVCNVDDLTDIDLNALIDFGPDTLCVSNPRIHYGVVETDGFDISQFREKPLLKGIWASCGLYFLSKNTINRFPDRGSLEQDVWPYTRLKAFKHFGMWKTFHKC